MFTWLKNWFKGKENSFDQLQDLPTNHEVQVGMANVLLRDIIKERRLNRVWTILKRLAFAVTFLIGLIYYIIFQATSNGFQIIPSQPLVGVIRIEGDILHTTLASSEKIVPALKRAFETENVQAIILSIDSPGGAPVEAERINYVLDSLKKKYNKPVYAVIQNVGASAAYMIALHTDEIYAGRYSMVGSIGAVLSTWDVHKALARHDVYQRVFASGELKSMLNPFIPTTKAAEEKAQGIVNVMGQRFHSELMERRGDLLQAGTKYDTGEIWDGEAAKALGLIDKIGTIEMILEKYPNAKLHEFGPQGSNSRLFSASIGDWAQTTLTNSIKNAITQPTLQ